MPNLNFADYKALTGDNTVTGWVSYNWIGANTPSPELPYNKTYDFTTETDVNNFIESLSLWPNGYEYQTKNYYRNPDQYMAFDSNTGGLMLDGVLTNVRAGLYFSFKPDQLTNNVTVEIRVQTGVFIDFAATTKLDIVNFFHQFNDGTVDGPRLVLRYDPARTEGKFYWTWRKHNTDGTFEDVEVANRDLDHETTIWKFNFDFDNQVITIFKGLDEILVDNTSCSALNLRSYSLLNNSFGNNAAVRRNAYEVIYDVRFTEVNPGK